MRDKLWLRGIGFAFLTATFQALSAVCAEILNDRELSIFFGLLMCYFLLLCVFAPIRVTQVISRENSIASSLSTLRDSERKSKEDLLETKKEESIDVRKEASEFFNSRRVCFENVRDQLFFAPTRRSFCAIVMVMCDFSGNYSQLSTYYYTSVTSGSLFLSATVPISMLLGFFFLGRTYRTMHIAGALICCGGLGFMIVADLYAKTSDGEINAVLGDICGVTAALFYSISNVLQEFLIQDGATEFEILTSFGVHGCICSLLALLIQYDFSVYELHAFFKSIVTVLEWFTYISLAVVVFFSYQTINQALTIIDSGTFNVVMLQQSLLVGIARVCGFDGGFTIIQAVFFFVTFVVQLIGIGLFASAGDVKNSSTLILDDFDDERSVLLHNNNNKTAARKKTKRTFLNKRGSSSSFISN